MEVEVRQIIKFPFRTWWPTNIGIDRCLQLLWTEWNLKENMDSILECGSFCLLSSALHNTIRNSAALTYELWWRSEWVRAWEDTAPEKGGQQKYMRTSWEFLVWVFLHDPLNSLVLRSSRLGLGIFCCAVRVNTRYVINTWSLDGETFSSAMLIFCSLSYGH